MNSYIALLVYFVTFIAFVYIFRKILRKRLFPSIVVALIAGQISLIVISYFFLFSGDNSTTEQSTSVELIFWSINLLTPILVYGSLVYYIYTKKL